MSYQNPRAVIAQLMPRDLAILDDVEAFRLLTTRQVQRLHFRIAPAHHASFGAATKATMRVLSRLQRIGVIGHLERRIGGARRGSQGFIWQLTSTGATVQRTRRGETRRRRYIEPSALFTDHTLAVADLAVTIRELADSGALEILDLETEPACWRGWAGHQSIAETLKPDLHAVTATAEFQDHLFIEADQGTEHLPQILTKCRVYARYHQAGIEQHTRGVFPAVLWVTPTEKRAAALERAIAKDESLPPAIFHVITTSQFVEHLTESEESP